jgi:hypothetical protein
LAPLCVDSESLERVERVKLQLEMVTRCAHRISCSAETLGAVHQERRVSRAVLLADKYLQTLRTKCEKFAAELAETKYGDEGGEGRAIPSCCLLLGASFFRLPPPPSSPFRPLSPPFSLTAHTHRHQKISLIFIRSPASLIFSLESAVRRFINESRSTHSLANAFALHLLQIQILILISYRL